MSATERYGFDLTGDLPRAAQELDAAFAGAWAPRVAGHVKATRTFAYFGGPALQLDGTVDIHLNGTIVCPDNTLSLVQREPVTGTVIVEDPPVLLDGYVPMALVRCVSGELTRFLDVRDSVLGRGARRLDELEDVSLYGLQDGDILVYDSATGLWFNTVNSGSGGMDVQEDGTNVVVDADTLNFTGSGVSVSDVGGVPTVNVPGTGTIPPIDIALFHRLNMILSLPGSNTPQLIGFTDPAGSGTATSPARSTANFNASQKRIRQTSAAGTNEGAGRIYASGNEFFTLGDAAGVGGFTVVLRFGLVTLAAGCRGFFGLCRVSPIANADPDTKIDILGLGWRDTDSNWHMIHNDGSGTATMVDTGVAFAVDICYEVEIDAGPNSTAVFVRLYSVNATGRTLLYQGNPTTDLPTGSLFMAPSSGINTAAGVSAIAMDFHHWIGDTR